MRPISRLTMMALAALSEHAKYGIQVELKEPYTPSKFKKCIVCGKPRYHNNSFCSPECCKQYKASQNNLTK